MKQTNIIMGMPITIEVVDQLDESLLADTFRYFRDIDARYSPYKPSSEISRINAGLPRKEWSEEVKHIMHLCEQTKQQSGGYFNIKRDGRFDPSGLVKGWAIHQAAHELSQRGARNFYIEAGGDIQTYGTNGAGRPWRIGIRNPFIVDEIVKVVEATNKGVATSGTYVRGQHIYNPFKPGQDVNDVKSLTVIAPNIYEADRFATAAFAMGRQGIHFIERVDDLEGYLIDSDGSAVFTSGFQGYAVHD